MKNILQICKDVANIVCIQEPLKLFGDTGQNEKIFLSVANDTLNGLLRYGDWQELTKDGILRTIYGKSDYPIADFCPDFYQLLNNTVYIKDKAEKLIGAITPEQWQKEKYFHDDNSQIKFKIQNSMFRFLTPPPADIKIVFQYRSAVIAYDKSLFIEKTEITADTDIPIFDEYLVKLGICWRLQARNGQSYQEEFAEYERECRKRFGSSLAAKDISLGSPIENSSGVFVYAKTQH